LIEQEEEERIKILKEKKELFKPITLAEIK